MTIRLRDGCLAKLGFTPRHFSFFRAQEARKSRSAATCSLLPRLDPWLSVRAGKLMPVNGLNGRAQGAIVTGDFHRHQFLHLLPPPGLTRHLKGPGHQIVGVDTSPSLVAAARELDPSMDLRLADAAALPLDDASADLAIAFMSLHDIDRCPPPCGKSREFSNRAVNCAWPLFTRSIQPGTSKQTQPIRTS